MSTQQMDERPTGRLFATLAGGRPERVGVGRLDHMTDREHWVRLTPDQADQLALDLIRLAQQARDDDAEFTDEQGGA